jgi:serine/threonine-protein kinase
MTEFAEQLQDALGPTYQLDNELTGGGMSRVFAAVDRSLGRRVVVKVLPPDLAAGVNRERFRREIQVAAQLQHPHIVPLLSAGEHGDLLWYTMPFIDGESLRAAIERKRTFSPREVVRILHDVVDALAFAHARGVIHRDIKPANILTQGSHALVTDFGVAKAISAALPIGSVTTAGIAIGTPAYMAPEQLAGDPAADHRIDIYAVGLLAYELLTGVSPFTGASPRETLAAQLTRDPAPLHEIAPGVPRNVSTLVMRCLAKDPAARPQSADEILQELDSLTMPFGVTPQGGGVEAPVRRRPWRSVAAVGILAIVLAGVGYAVSKQRDRMTVVVSPPTAPSVKPTPDTAKKMAQQAAPAPAGPVAAPAPPVVTHDDSVRIAAAVQKRVAAAKLRDSLAKAKLAQETERKMMDSIIAANSGGGGASVAAAPRRLIIAEPPEISQWPEAALLGRAVADSLRRMLRSRARQYTLVDQDSVRMALSRSRDIAEMSKTLGSDLLVSIRLTAMPRDSAMLLLQLWDLGANNTYRTRATGGRRVAKNEVLAGLDAVLLSTITYLDEMSRAPRRTTPPSSLPTLPPIRPSGR